MSAAELQQLTAMDAMFLTQESSDAPLHIGLLMFYTRVKILLILPDYHNVHLRMLRTDERVKTSTGSNISIQA